MDTARFQKEVEGYTAPIGMLYICSSLISNVKMGMGHEGQGNSRFGVTSTTLESYLDL